MESKIIDARSPKWVNAERTPLDMEVHHAEYGWIPSTASPDDPMDYGRVLFQAALDGELGEIAEYVAQVKSAEEIERDLMLALDRHIDATAKAKGYHSRITCAMRAGYANPWQTECIAFGQWMDACYLLAIGIAAEVKAGQRAVPTEAELIAAMPAMEWPAA